MKERDERIIDHILSYCDDILQLVKRFGEDYSIFESTAVAAMKTLGMSKTTWYRKIKASQIETERE